MTKQPNFKEISLSADISSSTQLQDTIENNNSKEIFQIHQPKLQHHIAVVATNTQQMKETGFGTIETCKFFYDILNKKYQKVTFHDVSSKTDLYEVVLSKPDLVVLCSKYLMDVDSNTRTWFVDYFSEHEIAFTGSDRQGLEFDSNKSKAKTTVQNHGIATANFFLAQPDQFQSEDKLPLPLPLFIKPMDAANGNGIDENSLARDFESYQKKVQELFTIYGANVLVEEVLSGREFTVAIFDDPQNNYRSIMPVEIITPMNTKGDRVLGSASKQKNDELLRAVTEPTLSAVSELAGSVFSALGAISFGRIDIKLDALGKPNFLEANLMPGMTPDSSYFPRACSLQSVANPSDTKPAGMSHSEVALKIVELGLNRVLTLEQVA
ncbi:hypothetical protein [Pseudovibrio sp. Tun.PSC04-5.I4]|uniref:hypothetical protein n=1 Tax=Pseudovibrio sp. Tun.PSC04-5.I4 TaxID=1798213 RepID=UPI0008887FDB|nr:hypothetical protein [Pseudovibrio sp. Tun.PSC04-5.I4]SDR01577.1 D-alanine-D-alanine ligase [Pseudovibrio sp. Tun.PSC04-5.I4]